MVALFLLLTLTGCWSRYEVQNMNYATAVGIDYVDGQYTLYVQLLDFSTVAKLEGQHQHSNWTNAHFYFLAYTAMGFMKGVC